MSPAELDSLLRAAVADHKAGKIADAATKYRKLHELQPHVAIVVENLGVIEHEAKRFDQAIAFFRRAIELEPRTAIFYRNLGSAYRAIGKPQEAVVALRKAVELAPEDGFNWGELGVSLDQSGGVAEAFAVYEKAARLLAPLAKPAPPGSNAPPPNSTAVMELARAFYNHGSVLGRWYRVEEAMGDYEMAIRLKPDFAEPHRNRAGVLFSQGKFKEGWAEYEWRWRCGDYEGKPPDFHQPQWDGSPLNGRTILLWWEQGFGDTIQFCRYAPLIKARGGRVALLCQPELKRLLQTLDGVDELAYNGERKIIFDTHVSLMSVPHFMGTTRETIPAAKSYLKADPNDSAVWEARLANDGPGFRVGLVWAGGAAHRNDQRRSIPFPLLEPLIAVPGIKFYTLQLGEPANQLRNSGMWSAGGGGEWRVEGGESKLSNSAASPPTPHSPPSTNSQKRVIDHTAHLRDFADTAAFIDRLDLLISVDTAPVHVAGAIGKPVWTLMPYESDFRWMTDTDNPSRWYPSMRHFRQNVIGDWRPVIASVTTELRKTASGSLSLQGRGLG